MYSKTALELDTPPFTLTAERGLVTGQVFGPSNSSWAGGGGDTPKTLPLQYNYLLW
jgi:hypothetical protein